MKKVNYFLSLCSLLGLALLFSCSDDDDPPPAENEEEVIDLVRLTFSSTNPGSPDVVVEASDEDGEGPEDFKLDVINLSANEVYNLSIEVRNTEEGENITEEIEREATAHQFFFAWTGQIFVNPTGLGNYANDGQGQGPYGNVGGTIGYDDFETDYQSEPDEDGVAPRGDVRVGLATIWETGDASTTTYQFRVVLMHQPGEKTATTNSNTGDPDVDLTFDINIQ